MDCSKCSRSESVDSDIDDLTYVPTQAPSQDFYAPKDRPKQKVSQAGKNARGRLQVFLPGGALHTQTTDTQFFDDRVQPGEDRDTRELKPLQSDDDHVNHIVEGTQTAEETIAELKAKNYDLECTINGMQQELTELESQNMDQYQRLESYRCDTKAEKWYVGQLEAEIERVGGEMPNRLESQIAPWHEDDDGDNYLYDPDFEKMRAEKPLAWDQAGGEAGQDGLMEHEVADMGVIGAQGDASSTSAEGGECLDSTTASTQEVGGRSTYEKDMLETIIAGAPSNLRMPKAEDPVLEIISRCP